MLTCLSGDEIENAEYGTKLGSGSYGKVYAHRGFAIKSHIVHTDEGEDFGQIRASAIKEFCISRGIPHPHISEVLDIHGCKFGYAYTVSRVAGMNLWDAIRDPRSGFDKTHAIEIGIQLLSALDCLHHSGVVHGDFKPANILFQLKSGRPFVSLIDFGLAKLYDYATVSPVEQTDIYRAPEIDISLYPVERQTHPASDMWAFGATYFHILAGHPLMPEINDVGPMRGHILNSHCYRDNHLVKLCNIARITKLYPYSYYTRGTVMAHIESHFEIGLEERLVEEIGKTLSLHFYIIRACMRVDAKRRVSAADILRVIKHTGHIYGSSERHTSSPTAEQKAERFSNDLVDAKVRVIVKILEKHVDNLVFPSDIPTNFINEACVMIASSFLRCDSYEDIVDNASLACSDECVEADVCEGVQHNHKVGIRIFNTAVHICRNIDMQSFMKEITAISWFK